MALYGKSAGVGGLVSIGNVDGIELYLGWAKGRAKYLEV